jgi:hypothetical protein
MNTRKVICIKARSHSDFELYLIGEKYDIPYEFLIEYKKDKHIYKFWTEIRSGKILALEARAQDNTKVVEAIADMSAEDKMAIMEILPIRAGEVIAKHKGNIEDKEREFQNFLTEKEAYRKEMLSRKYDHKNIVCINTHATEEQLFAVSINNKIDFMMVSDFIKGNRHIDITRAWFEKGTSELVAYNYIFEAAEWFEVNPASLIPRTAISKMSRRPVAVPKIKTSTDIVSKYVAYKAIGYDLEIPKFDRLIDRGFLTESANYSEDIDMGSFSVEELQTLLEKAIQDEDYESAALLRDEINKMK